MSQIDTTPFPEKEEFKKDDLLYKRGNQANKIYRIEHGTVFLNSKNDNGKVLIESIKTAGHIIGYAETIADKEYQQNAICMSEVKVSCINREDFMALMLDQEYNAEFVNLMANQIMHKQNKVLCFAYCSVQRRVITALIKLDKTFNVKKEYPFFVEIKRTEIASLSGTVKETAIRTLKVLADDGLIDLQRHGVTILNRKRLEEESHSKLI